MKVHVFFHDRCFDGAASAAVFTRFYQDCFRSDAEFVYTGLVHRASQLFDEKLFDGDENAIVDFKYSASSRLHWWFDHHQSAFLSSEDAEHFRRDRTGRKFYDPSFKSCTKLIDSVGREKFGFAAPDLEELIHWADIVDGALFADAEQRLGDQTPRPAHWGGYRLFPTAIEFWQGRANRLHDRVLYTLKSRSWKIERLAP